MLRFASLALLCFCVHQLLSMPLRLDRSQHASYHHQLCNSSSLPTSSCAASQSTAISTPGCSIPAQVLLFLCFYHLFLPRYVSHWRSPCWRCTQLRSWRPFGLKFPLKTLLVRYLKQTSRSSGDLTRHNCSITDVMSIVVCSTRCLR